MIKIDFTINDGRFSYSDAIYLPLDHTFTSEEIENMKRARFIQWRDLIDNPPSDNTVEENI